MKILLVSFSLIFYSFFSFADEGMWLPFLLEQTTMSNMQAAGCRMSAEDIYSINHTSMKDGVLLFNGGCTGEMISNEGLLLTNHHCGFGYVQQHSSVENDYVKNGFWAMNRKEEYACPGLTVTFIIRMEDVTDKIVSAVKNIIDEAKRNLVIDSLGKQISMQAIAGTKYTASVRPIYYGNQFILIVSENFLDVRLVGAPPEAVGNFGGDDENWMWPRQTGDFSLFRIYADKNNDPAIYSADNVPYQPKYYFPVSLKGEKEGDFAMVYGFPGRTTEYISSYAVEFIKNVTDPDRVKIRTVKLNIWMNEMQKNNAVNIQYAAKYSGIANGWKKWQGEMLGLQQYKVAEMKKRKEDSIMQIISTKTEFTPYGNILSQLKLAYDTLSQIQFVADYYNEALRGSEAISFAEQWLTIIDEAMDPNKPSAFITHKTDLINAVENFYKNYQPELDKKVTEALLKLFLSEMQTPNIPAQLSIDLMKFKNDVHAYTEFLFSKSCITNESSALNAIRNLNYGKKIKLSSDPVILLAKNLKETFNSKCQISMNRLFARINLLNKQFMQFQLLAFSGKKNFYPDANSTLRIAYGNVKGYQPRDAVKYKWFTTADGVNEKNNPDNFLYTVPEKLKTLIAKKDFGNYADADGELHTCLITNCHSTGGNSGSPVLDADGNLIGTNFDRVYEGTMSDVYYNPEICRNVSVDIRYTLFLIDKFAGAGYLLNEMKIVRQ